MTDTADSGQNVIGERSERMRDAAEKLRNGTHGVPREDLALMLADWVDAEAATLPLLEPFAELMNAAIESQGGPKSYLRFGCNEDGSPVLNTDTSSHASRIADHILGDTA